MAAERSVRKLCALPLRATLALLEAGLEAAARVLRVALLLVGRPQDEPGLGIAGIEGDRSLARLDSVGDLAALEGELRGVLFFRGRLGIGLRRDLGVGRGSGGDVGRCRYGGGGGANGSGLGDRLGGIGISY